MTPVDRVVNFMTGHARLSFLDTYSGYHQIRMDSKVEEKTGLITDSGIYCYIRTLFDLKNAGTTYQKVMDHAFEDQIGRNVEV